MKKTKIATPTVDKETCKFWGIEIDKEFIVTKEYFYNGETHIKGYYASDTTRILDFPAIFFNIK